MSTRVNIHLHGCLTDFIANGKRGGSLNIDCRKTRSVKDLIESLGIPHPEIDLIVVNQRSVDFNWPIAGGETIEVYPADYRVDLEHALHLLPATTGEPRFILDVHLGKLAGYLRLFGFDSLYRNDYDDPELAAVSAEQERILLTCDVKLLMRKQVRYGYWVRARKPRLQLIEVINRYELTHCRTGVVRCIDCNGIIHAVAKQQIEHRLQPLTRLHYHEFYQCDGCNKLYWKGSHYDHMEQFRTRIEQRIHSEKHSD